MSTFEESAHPRAGAGTFTTTTRIEPGIQLDPEPAGLELEIMGDVVVKHAGKCTCGVGNNGSWEPHEQYCGIDYVASLTELGLTDPADVTEAELRVAVDRYDAARATAEAPYEPGALRVDGDWVVEDSDGCTCGGYGEGSGWTHEPGCGTEPIAQVADLDLTDPATATRADLHAAVLRFAAADTPTRDASSATDPFA
jgi:hypothetical protein